MKATVVMNLTSKDPDSCVRTRNVKVDILLLATIWINIGIFDLFITVSSHY